jgi:hypothetical protein
MLIEVALDVGLVRNRGDLAPLRSPRLPCCRRPDAGRGRADRRRSTWATDDIDHELSVSPRFSASLSSGLLRVEELDHESASETSFQDAAEERPRTLLQDEKTQRCCRFLKRVSFAASNLEQPVRSAP